MEQFQWLIYVGATSAVVIAVIVGIYKFGIWHGEINSDREMFKNFMDEIRNDLNEIRNDLKNIFSRLPPSPTSSASPIYLTDLGERISKNVDAKSWPEKQAEEVVDETKNMDSFEIQEFSFSIAQSLEPDETLRQKMRDSAFQEGIPLKGVKDVLGVELRDVLLRLHKKNTSITGQVLNQSQKEKIT